MRIVIATDGTAASAAIFEQLGQAFVLPDTFEELNVVTVHDTTAVESPFPLVNALGLISHHSIAAADTALEEARLALGPLADRATFIRIDGVPGPELVHYLKAHHTDLLIVGRGQGHDHDRALLGSVSSHVVAHAPCTVIVVKPRAAERSPNP